jgi:hypothetical protein
MREILQVRTAIAVMAVPLARSTTLNYGRSTIKLDSVPS